MINRRAFTLPEILLVVVIIGLLAAAVLPKLSGRSEKVMMSMARADIQSNIPTALKMYELDNGMFPSTAQGLQALLEKPTTAPLPRNWQGPYLEKGPIDPWGNPYVYASPGTHRSDYDLYSKGKDPNYSDGYIVNW